MPLVCWRIEDCTGCLINFDLLRASWVGNADEGIYYVVYVDLNSGCWRYLAAAGDETRHDGLKEVLALTNYQFATSEDAVHAARKRCKLWCTTHGVEITDVPHDYNVDRQGPSREKTKQVVAASRVSLEDQPTLAALAKDEELERLQAKVDKLQAQLDRLMTN